MLEESSKTERQALKSPLSKALTCLTPQKRYKTRCKTKFAVPKPGNLNQTQTNPRPYSAPQNSP